MSKAGKAVIFKGRDYPTITALALRLGKTVSQLKNHLDAGTPVIGYEPNCIDYKLSIEDVEQHIENKRKLNERLKNRLKLNNYE